MTAPNSHEIAEGFTRSAGDGLDLLYEAMDAMYEPNRHTQNKVVSNVQAIISEVRDHV